LIKPVVKLIVSLFTVCLVLSGQALIEANAAEAVFDNLTTGTELRYEKSAVKYNYNGVDVTMNGNIGLLGESGSALAPVSLLFSDALEIDCEFSLADSSVILSDGSDSVKVIPGSKAAVVNGKKTEMSEAPVLLKNKSDELLFYVPTRFIASNLQFDYEWNKNLSTVFISKTYSMKYKSDYTEKPIAIPLAEELQLKDIRIEDLYYDNQIAVYIPGNHVDEYKDNVIVNHYSAITDIQLALNAANETMLVFDTSKLVACKPEIKNQTLYLTLMNPRELYSKIVVIDPGHGGYDPGAIREKINESDINLSVAYEYTKDLFAESDIKVYYTRVKDKFISLDERAAFAAKTGADFFVSVHQNTFTTDGKKGVSVYYSSDNKNTGVSGLTGRIMAGIFTESLSEKLGLKNIGRLNQRLTVTTNNSVPAALIELAFMSNPEDFSKLKDEEFRKKAGQAIFDTITAIFEEYPTNR